MLTTEQFFDAAKKAGMTRPLSWTPSAGGPVQSADVIYKAPNRDVLAGEVSATDHMISFPATKLTALKRGEIVIVDGVSFTVREGPESELDGSRRKAYLTKGAS